MRDFVAYLIVIGLLVIPLHAYRSAQENGMPPCADDIRNYPDNMIRPKYPKDALRKGISGKIELRAMIGSDGKTKNISVLSGDPELSQAALTAIRKWHFHPEFHEGRPVETIYKIQVRFNSLLQEANSDVELESPRTERPAAAPLAKTHQDFGAEVHQMSEPGMVAPKQLYSPEPEFSEKSRREKKAGVVGIILAVGTDGLPQDLRIACSSVPENNENALAAVKTWRFAPATKDGKPVAVAVEIDVSFKLN